MKSRSSSNSKNGIEIIKKVVEGIKTKEAKLSENVIYSSKDYDYGQPCGGCSSCGFQFPGLT